MRTGLRTEAAAGAVPLYDAALAFPRACNCPERAGCLAAPAAGAARVVDHCVPPLAVAGHDCPSRACVPRTALQPRHLAKSNSGRLSTIRTAPNLHARSHLPHPMHPASQASRTTLPPRCAEHVLCTGWLAATSCSTPRGQAVMHTPHPTQLPRVYLCQAPFYHVDRPKRARRHAGRHSPGSCIRTPCRHQLPMPRPCSPPAHHTQTAAGNAQGTRGTAPSRCASPACLPPRPWPPRSFAPRRRPPTGHLSPPPCRWLPAPRTRRTPHTRSRRSFAPGRHARTSAFLGSSSTRKICPTMASNAPKTSPMPRPAMPPSGPA